jgi:hypothetical protein
MMVLDSFWTAILFVLAATGALCWLCAILMTIYFWMCKPTRSE